jgi:N-acetylglucosamine repressor
MQMHKGDQELVRNQNRALVINLLRLHGPLSRSEVSERTGLAPSALTRLSRDLLADGIVIETGKSDSTGGRPAVLVSLNPEYSRSIGIKVERARVLAAAVDLTGAIRDRADISFETPPSPAEVIASIAKLVEKLSFERILGIGISISGFVDPATGMDLYSPILGWRNVPLRDPISQRTGLPVWIENDVNALALAERWYGAGRNYNHFICITVGEGIGAGVVIGGEIYRGAFGGAGELGHITINPDGPVCRCQERGCLEVYASDYFLNEEASRLGFPDIQGLIDAARNGDADAKVAFARMGRYLGFGAKNLVNLLNPEAIILGGERMDASDLFLSAIEDEVRRHSFPSEADRLQIVPTELGADGFLIGSATLVAADFFRVPAKGGVG